MKRYIYIIFGLVFVGLGILGIVLPGLPTTPFLLLASWFFYRSSSKLQIWLLQSWLGKYIHNYHQHGGMTKKQKFFAILTMFLMIGLSIFIFLPKESFVRIIVLIAGIIGAFVVSFLVPNAK